MEIKVFSHSTGNRIYSSRIKTLAFINHIKKKKMLIHITDVFRMFITQIEYE